MTLAALIGACAHLHIKLTVDGAQLRVSAPAGVITPELRAALAEHKQSLIERLVSTGAQRVEPVAAAPVADEFPLSYTQHSLWLLLESEPASSPAYNVRSARYLRGKLSPERLEQAIRQVIRRQPALRTVFLVKHGVPQQRQLPDIDFRLAVEDLSALSAHERTSRYQSALQEEGMRVFDLNTAPLFHIRLLRMADDEHVLLLNAHHLIADAWSAGVFLHELTEAYAKPDEAREQLAFGYAEFVMVQRHRLEPSALDQQLAYWQSCLEGTPPLQLPLDFPRPRVSAYEGDSVSFELPDALVAATKEFARQEGFSVFQILLGAFAAFLRRFSGQTDLGIGYALAGRNTLATEAVIGHFVNLVVLRSDVSRRATFRELLQNTRERTIEAFDNQDLPFDRLVRALRTPRDPGRNPVFQTLFLYLQGERERRNLYGLDAEALPVPSVTSKYDCSLHITEDGSRLTGAIEYRTDLFRRDTVEKFADFYVRVLAAALHTPDAPLYQLPVLQPSERQQLLEGYNGDQHSYSESTLVALFEEQAARTPDRIALTCGAQHRSYRELNDRANQLAHHLIAMGAGPEVVVGICLERSLEMIVAPLGVLKAGAAYLPIDPEYPDGRIQSMVADAKPLCVITSQWLAAASEAITSNNSDNPASRLLPDSAAYVIYTSGSTGKPKGVVVTHQNAVRLFAATRDWFSFDETDVWTLFHSFAFDFSVWEIWGPLLHGGRLVIVPKLVSRSPKEFLDLLAAERVTVLNQTPSAFYQLVQSYAGNSVNLALRYIVFGGEALEFSRLEDWYRLQSGPGPQLINMYGITETTVHVTYQPLDTDRVRSGAGSQIGCNIPDLRIYVLDENLEPAPTGVIGEMYVAGAGLARGYLHAPALTAERFVADPHGPAGTRMYRTGDLARRQPDGNLEYLGRIDQQVKIRGFRIELGEIEAALLAQPEVAQAAVVLRETAAGSSQLVAYIVPDTGASPDSTALRKALGNRLPDYMTPAAVVALTALPLTTSGKLNRAALPEPERQHGDHLAPRTPKEELLCSLTAELLSMERVGSNDNFFSIGGDSIVAIMLANRAAKAGLSFSPRDIFQNPTMAGLAEVAKFTAGAIHTRADDTAEAQPTPIMHWLLERRGPIDRYCQSILLRVPLTLQESALRSGLAAIVRTHSALRVALVEEQGEWKLQIPASTGQVSLHIDAGGFTEAALHSAEARLDVRSGNVFEAVWFPAVGRLLLVIHHIAVDGVSWRILMGDLAAACGAAPLSAESMPFLGWAAQITQWAASDAVKAELPYWEATVAADSPLFPSARLDPSRDTVSTKRRLDVSLPINETESLLSALPTAHRCSLEEILIAALAVAARRERGITDGLLIDLESHGRDPLDEFSDPTRSIGWFTAMYPVRLAVQADNLRIAVRDIKEQLRAVPSRGLGFGLLRYSRPDTRTILAGGAKAQIAWNYLGRIPQSGIRDWELAPESPPRSSADEALPLAHLIETDVAIQQQDTGAILTASWQWASEAINANSVRGLAESWRYVLLELIAQLGSTQESRYAPSDFPLVPLTQADVSAVESTHPHLEDILPLSPLQEGLLFHLLYDSTSPDLYTVRVLVRMDGPLDSPRMRHAAERLLQRHGNLRVAIQSRGLDKPVQVVLRDPQLQWRHTLGPDSFDALRAEDNAEQFSISTGPLLRIGIASRDHQTHLLLLTAHHILLDGWSIPILFDELLRLYADAAPLPPARPYAHYLGYLQRQDQAAAKSMWRQYLGDEPQPTLLSPKGKSEMPARMPERIETSFPEALTESLTQLARAKGITASAVMQGIWAILLSRFTGRKEVLFGITVSGRPADLQGVETMVGLFINTLPLRISVRPERSIGALFEEIQLSQASMLPFHQVSLAEIQREAGAGNLFDTLLVFENYPLQPGAFLPANGLRVTGAEMRDATHYPLTVVVLPGERLHVRMDYDPSVFDLPFVEQILSGLKHLATIAAQAPETPIHRCSLLQPSERHQLLAGYNGEQHSYSESTLVALFEEQAARTPDRIALTCGGQHRSYRELNDRANQLAHHLIAIGSGPDVVVGICLERSLEMIVALLGVLKAGAAYLPIDPEYPDARIQSMVADAKPLCVITSQWLAAASEAITSNNSDNPASRLLPDSAAYVIYTSGSTGKPKGVVVTHQNAVRLFAATRDWFSFDETDVWTLFHSFAFDFSVWEIWGPLLHGGRLVIVPKLVSRSPKEFLDLLAAERVTVLNQTPSAFYQLVQSYAQKTVNLALRYIVFGGEALEFSRIEDWYRLQTGSSPQLINMYGITETTVHVTYQPLDTDRVRSGAGSQIGCNIPDLRIYVLDENLEPAPTGVIGEMYVAGAGLARGYLNAPALTAERFVADPHGPAGTRMYRTGDLARRQPDGNLEYLGRIDQQVKIRGFRIELGEIEAALLAQPEVAQAAVIAKDSSHGGKRLIAYVVPTVAAWIDDGSLRQAISGRLPDYMIPSAIVVIPDLPLTVHGKLDRRALPEPQAKAHTARVAPRDSDEEIIARIWSEVLEIPEVGITENFFELGGQSLLATQVISRINDRCGVSFDLRVLFEQPTVQGLATAVKTQRSTPAAAIPSPRIRRARRTSGQISLQADGEIAGEVPIGVGN